MMTCKYLSCSMCVGSWQAIVGTNCEIISIIVGRYYLADAGYTKTQGYMTPFWNTRYHINDFRGVELETLEREEKLVTFTRGCAM